MNPQFFIQRPRFALVISLVITILGILAAQVMPIDQYPSITAPKIVVRANFPGASSDTIRDAVAAPIEEQVNGAEGMVYMSSKSASDGTYSLTVTFDISVDPALAQVDVQNRVKLAEPRLPAEVRQRGVTVKKRSPDMLLAISVYSPDNSFDGIFLSNFTSLNIKQELARVPGVGEANILGPLDYGMRVWLDPVKLASSQISVNEVLAAIEEQNIQAAVGQLGAPPTPDTTQFQYVLKTQGRLSEPEEFENIILRSDGRGSILRLRDVARVELGAQAYKGFGEYNNQPGTILAIYKLGEANALETAAQVIGKLEELKAYFPEGIDYTIANDTTLFIKSSLEETLITLCFTIVLVILVSYIFLGNLRATLVPTIAIPVCIIGTLGALYVFGMTINTVTLFALILAIGVVVDDAILVVENVERLMHEENMEPRQATELAMKQIAAPIVATSLVLFAVFAPTMLLPGITGKMFAQFGATIVVAVLISAVNALSLSPALCALVLKREESRPNLLIRTFNRFFAVMTAGYIKLVDFLLRHLVFSVAIILALFASLVFLFGQTTNSFLPDEDKGYFFVDVQLPPAASLNRTSEAMDEIYSMISDDPAVEKISMVNGYSLLNQALQSNTGLFIIKLKPWSERKAPEQHQFALQKKYRQVLSQLPGTQVRVFGAPAIPGLGSIAGFSYVLEDMQGRSPEQMREMLMSLLPAANQRPEIARAFSTFRADFPQIWLEVDRERAKTLGIKISDIFLALQTHLGSFYINDFNKFGQTYRVMVQADSVFRQKETNLKSLYVNNNKGESIALSGLVSTRPVQGADVLYRYNLYNSAVINGQPNVADGFSSGDAMLAMEGVSANSLSPGWKFDWTDSSFEERKSGNAAPIALVLALIFTYLFLAALYESFTMPIAIILSVPIAMIGALIALWVYSEPLSLYGQIGMVLLLGMAAKVAILIVEFGKSLRETEGMELHEATILAARQRFRPVNMTALSFVVGVFPLVIASGAGAASRVSLGLVVFGGMLMSAIAGTLLVPVFFRLAQALREKIHGGPTKPP